MCARLKWSCRAPVAKNSSGYSFKDMRSAIEVIPEIIPSKTTSTALEYLSRYNILFAGSYLGKRFPDTGYGAYILLTFGGSTDTQVERDMSAVGELCLGLGAPDAYIVDTEERRQGLPEYI